MSSSAKTATKSAAWLVLLLAAQGAAEPIIENARYRLSADGAKLSVVAKQSGCAISFDPRVVVYYRPGDPGFELAPLSLEGHRAPSRYDTVAPSWRRLSGEGRTLELAEAATVIEPEAERIALEQGALVVHYAPAPHGALSLRVSLPGPDDDPLIEWRWEPRVAGWWCVELAGAPNTLTDEIVDVWQPPIWHGRRIPWRTSWGLEHAAFTPAVIVATTKASLGLAVDPASIPFRLPTLENAQFMLALVREGESVRPTIAAPVFGRAGSQRGPGERLAMQVRMVLDRADWFEVYRHVATNIGGLRDYRNAPTTSLNTTFDNLVNMAMDPEYGGWLPEARGFDYGVEIAGNAKVVSALHPLSVAILTDREDIYRERAIPTLEYLLSREKFGFSQSADTFDHEGPSHLLAGPACEAGDLASEYALLQRQSPTLLTEAERLYYAPPRVLNLNRVSPGDDWANALALYLATHNAEYLRAAEQGADEYIARRITQSPVDFSDAGIESGGQFWTDLLPRWQSLLDLYEVSGERRYLDASLVGARQFATCVWTSPMPPPGDVTIHSGGQLGLYAHGRKRRDATLESSAPATELQVPERRVPAWSVSQVGLAPESLVTYSQNQAVFLAMHAGAFLRLAHHSGDELLATLARSAVVGRYESFPGYDINGEFTDYYAQADYLRRPLGERVYNEVYYNHLWPQISVVVDYLLSEAFYRSAGAIDFPWLPSRGYAYLQNRVYGHAPGKVYDRAAARLWMPTGLITGLPSSVDYVTAYNEDELLVMLLNQADAPQHVDCRFDLSRLSLGGKRETEVQVWQENSPAAATVLSGGKVAASVASKGITVLALQGVAPRREFQAQLANDDSAPPRNRGQIETLTTPFGVVKGVFLSAGPKLTSAYIYTTTTEQQLAACELTVTTPTGEQRLSDDKYPFEFTVPIDVDQPPRFMISGIAPDGVKYQKTELPPFASMMEQAPQQLSIDANYPGGNIVVERIEGNAIDVRPDLRDTPDWWFYWNFRVRGAGNRELTFRFPGRSPLGARGPAVSEDGGKSWVWTGRAKVNDQPEQASFQYLFKPEVNEVRFAFAMPYQLADWNAFIAPYLSRDDVAEKTLCRTTAGRDVKLLDIRPRERDAGVVLLTARHHACETMASYALEGCVQELLRPTPNDSGALPIRYLVAPLMDLDGVEAGDQGKNRRPHDHWLDYSGESQYASVAALRKLIADPTTGPLRVAIDFHCSFLREDSEAPGSSERIFFMQSGNPKIAGEAQRFGRDLRRAQRGPLLYDGQYDLPLGVRWNTPELAGPSFLGWAEQQPSVWFATVLELPYANAAGAAVTPESARAFGADFATALRNYLSGKLNSGAETQP